MGFNAKSTAEEVARGVDLRGKIIVVTGASAGLGFESARILAKAGATIVVAGRDKAKTGQACAAIRAETPGAKVTPVTLDLGDLASVRRAAAEILAAHPRIDILMNNAGFVGGPLDYTAEGCERHFGVNHIGPFLLTNLLRPALKEGSRIVNLSSNAHRVAPLDFDDLRFERRPYDHWAAYSQSKAANVMFTVALAGRVKPLGVTVNAVHPGVIATEVFRYVPAEEKQMVLGWADASGSPVKSIPQGAATQVWAATAPELAGVTGHYLEDCGIAPVSKGDAAAKGVAAYAVDPASAERLWALSEEVVGQRF